MVHKIKNTKKAMLHRLNRTLLTVGVVVLRVYLKPRKLIRKNPMKPITVAFARRVGAGSLAGLFLISLVIGSWIMPGAQAVETITQVQKKRAETGAATSIAVTLDSATSVGNKLIAVLVSGSDTATTLPTGWVTLKETSTTDAITGIYWKDADGTAENVTFAGLQNEEHALMVYEYSGLATPPSDQSGTTQDNSGTNSAITATATGANSQADTLVIAGFLGWDAANTQSWSAGMTEEFADEHNGSFMNYGSATEVVSASETSSATVTMSTTQELYAIIATFKAGNDNSWYSASWDSRMQIRIEGREVDEPLTDFPVYLNLNDFGADFHDNVKSDGSDIRITSYDGITEMPLEVVAIDTGAANSGEVHFRADYLSPINDTYFYIYFDNASASAYADNATYGAENVWSNGYAAVYHLEEEVAGTGNTGAYKDSTSNGRDGDDYVSATGQTGQLGGGQQFDGTDDRIYLGTWSVTGDKMTLSAWAELDSTYSSSYPKIITKGSPEDWQLYYDTDFSAHTGALRAGGTADQIYSDSSTKDAMLFLAMTYDGSNVRYYVDGSEDANSPNSASGNLNNNTNAINIGNRLTDTRYWKGYIDELRVQSIGRSSEWVSTEFNNQNSTSNFYNPGALQTQTNYDDVWYDSANWPYRIKITVESTEVDAPIFDFPVYVDLSTLDSTDFHGNVRSDGGDIRITTADGITELPREVVDIDTTSFTGELHFEADYLSNTVDTDFYIYFGNSLATDYAVTDTFGAQNTWNPNYAFVAHLNEDPSISTDGDCSGGTDEACDSTSNDNDLNSNGTMTSGDLVGGKIGNGIDFDGSNDYLNATDNATLDITGDLTMSFWFDPVSATANDRWVTKMASANSAGYDLMGWAGDFNPMLNSSWDMISSGAISADMQLASFVKSGTTAEMFQNGVDLGNNWTGVTSSNGENSADLVLGGAFTYMYAGIMDEVRILNVATSATWVSTEYNNQSAPSTFIVDGALEEAYTGPAQPQITQEAYIFENDDGSGGSSGGGADWYNSSWLKRQKITVDNTQVDATLTDFPVYVDLNDMGTDFHANVKSDGSDIRVTQSDGTTEVPIELVAIDTGTPDSGELYFKANSLSSTLDSDFYIYYDNSAASAYVDNTTYGAENVWTNGYVSVWHLEKDCADSLSGCIEDSVGNSDLTSEGFATGGDNSVTGKIGNADDFDGVDAYHDYVSADASANVGTTYSVTAWVDPDTLGDTSIFSSEYNTELHFTIDSSGNLRGYAYAANTGSWPSYDVWASSGDVTTTGGWQYVGFTVDGTTGKLFYNGSEVSSYSQTTISTPSTSDGTSQIGGIGIYRDAFTPYYYPDAQIDEVRFSDDTRTATWLSTEYNNQNSPDTFYAVESYTTEGYGDIAATANSILAGSEFTTGKTLSELTTGQRLTLRTQLTNSGAPLTATDELALFYDRSDGIWTRVESAAPPTIADGTGCGTSGSTDFNCDEVYNGDDTSDGQLTDMAVAPDGTNWMAFYDLDTTGSDGRFFVARYVGLGNGNCDAAGGASGSDAWQCELVWEGLQSTDADQMSLAIAPDGTPWLAFRDSSTTSTLMVAEYKGVAGQDCDTLNGSGGSDYWDCTQVWVGDNSSDAWFSDITVDSSGTPWVVFSDSNTDDSKVWTAKYVGGSGDCDTLGGTGGSDLWDCTQVFDGSYTNSGQYVAITLDERDNPVVSFTNDNSNTDASLFVAQYVGSGGDCNTVGGSGGSSSWSCWEVYDGDGGNDIGFKNGLAVAPDGTINVSFYNRGTSSELLVAKYVGTAGQNCDSVGGVNGSDLWNCEIVYVDNTTTDVGTGSKTSLAFAPDGNPWVSFHDVTASDGSLFIAKYVGGNNGDCDTVGASSGSDNWECTEVYDGTNTNDGGNSSLVFDSIGRPWLSYSVEITGDSQVWIATANRRGEITMAPSLGFTSGFSLSASHTDMGTFDDTTDRDDADCLATATWNNGIHSNSQSLTGLVLPVGDVTAQCTEVSWVIDTSQAKPETTYRFVIATKDGPVSSTGMWRGPISVAVDGYPTLSVKENNEIRYSKDKLPKYTDCTDTDWGCEQINSTSTIGEDNAIAISPEGIPWVSYYIGGTDDNLGLAVYVGSGGSGCTNTAWNCTVIDSTGDVGSDTSISFDKTGAAWVSYKDITNGYLKVAKYVGSGGSGCAVSSWNCTVVASSSSVGDYTDMAMDKSGNPWVVYYDGTGLDLEIARYVGNSNGSGCASSDWICETIDSTDDSGGWARLAFSPEGLPWISYKYTTTNDDLYAAHYVGSGGTGCDTPAWTCEAVDTSTTNNVASEGGDIGFNSSGAAIISYHYATDNDLRAATYVGSGGDCDSLYSGSDAWTCDVVHATATDLGGFSSIASDSNGDPWIAYRSSANELLMARYVGTGGSCTDTAWDGCSAIDNFDPQDSSIAFDHSGTPWISSWDYDAGGLWILKMNLPPNKLTGTAPITAGDRNAGSADARYRLSIGTAPGTASQGVCDSISGVTGYCGMYHSEGNTEGVTVNTGIKAIYTFSVRYSSNTELPTVEAQYRSTLDPNTTGSTGDIVLQVYRAGSTNAWETLTTDSTSSTCTTTNCTITGSPTGTASEYFDAEGSNYWASYRIYQVESATTGFTLSFDGFKAPQTQSYLRHGGIFQNGLGSPFKW